MDTSSWKHSNINLNVKRYFSLELNCQLRVYINIPNNDDDADDEYASNSKLLAAVRWWWWEMRTRAAMGVRGGGAVSQGRGIKIVTILLSFAHNQRQRLQTRMPDCRDSDSDGQEPRGRGRDVAINWSGRRRKRQREIKRFDSVANDSSCVWRCQPQARMRHEKWQMWAGSSWGGGRILSSAKVRKLRINWNIKF